MADAILSPALLRELFSYDPETGLLSWKVAVTSGHHVGMIAGTPSSDGYLRLVLFGKKHSVHRIIWAIVSGSHALGEVDHIDGNKHNNRWHNLRDVPRVMNAENIRKAQANNTSSGLLGVTLERSSGLWKAQISVAKKNIHLGRYTTPEEAHQAYISAKRRLHEGCTI